MWTQNWHRTVKQGALHHQSNLANSKLLLIINTFQWTVSTGSSPQEVPVHHLNPSHWGHSPISSFAWLHKDLVWNCQKDSPDVKCLLIHSKPLFTIHSKSEDSGIYYPAKKIELSAYFFKNATKWPKNGQKWPKVAQIWPQMALNGPKWPKNDPKWSNGQMQPSTCGLAKE